MEPTYRDQTGVMRDDNVSTGGQWDDPMSKGSQGKWEHKQDDTGGLAGDTYASQNLAQSDYGSNTVGGGQTGTGPGGIDVQSAMSGQYGSGPDRYTGQTAAYADPRIAGGGGRQPDDDDEYGAAVGTGGGPMGKPSMTTRVKGAAEKLAGKITGDPVKQARGREREEGTF